MATVHYGVTRVFVYDGNGNLIAIVPRQHCRPEVEAKAELDKTQRTIQTEGKG